jgi:pyruvate dehydrogenase E2 component (dihydrolipoamide acetyltransferase)
MSRDPGLFEFRFPDIGEGLTEGTIVELRTAPGSHVKPGDALAVVETDKVVTEMPSPVEGIIEELPISKGQVVKVGQIVARIRTARIAEDESTVVGKLDLTSGGILPPSREHTGAAASAPAAARAAARAPGATPTPAFASKNVRASPVARRLAASAGIDLAGLAGTGPGNRILRTDVQARVSAESAAPVAPATPARADASAQGARGAGSGARKLSTLRLAIASAMEKSQAIPAAAVHDFTIVDELLSLRRDMNEAAGDKVGLLAFFVKAAAAALVEFPLLSSTYAPDRKEYVTFPAPSIGVAVDTEEGLVVPVVREPAGLSVPRIHAEIVRLTERARARTLLLEEIRGGSFTISNFGSFSGVYGNPMILPPQVGILGIGRIHEQPVVKEGAIVAAHVLPVSLVVDHRLIDGVYACKFLARFMELVSKPLLLVTR